MFEYLLIAICFYLMGILTLMIYAVIKNSSRCSRLEEQKKKEYLDYGRIAYEELEKREKEKNNVLKK